MTEAFTRKRELPSLHSLLQQWAQEAAGRITPEEAGKLLQFAASVCAANMKTRIMGTRSLEEILRKHVIDSLAAAPLLGGMEDARLIDIGSGAGFPGMILKIACPRLRATLLESNIRKCAFMQDAAGMLGLKGIQCLNDRAENAGHNSSCREEFDVVVCRAVSHLSVVTEYALPFLRRGGMFIAYKGSNARAEVKESSGALLKLGGRLTAIREYRLPEKNESRALILVAKAEHTPAIYPRRAGIPAKRPLR